MVFGAGSGKAQTHKPPPSPPGGPAWQTHVIGFSFNFLFYVINISETRAGLAVTVSGCVFVAANITTLQKMTIIYFP